MFTERFGMAPGIFCAPGLSETDAKLRLAITERNH